MRFYVRLPGPFGLSFGGHHRRRKKGHRYYTHEGCSIHHTRVDSAERCGEKLQRRAAAALRAQGLSPRPLPSVPTRTAPSKSTSGQGLLVFLSLAAELALFIAVSVWVNVLVGFAAIAGAWVLLFVLAVPFGRRRTKAAPAAPAPVGRLHRRHVAELKRQNPGVWDRPK